MKKYEITVSRSGVKFSFYLELGMHTGRAKDAIQMLYPQFANDIVDIFEVKD